MGSSPQAQTAGGYPAYSAGLRVIRLYEQAAREEAMEQLWRKRAHR